MIAVTILGLTKDLKILLGEEVAQTMYIHVSQYKNDKILKTKEQKSKRFLGGRCFFLVRC
jgi:hypothetical protein